ncbi:aromatic acid/H+ symport family MFS transporter [Vogesella sp. GCM10023246]|uniref:Aromatic acid/H+ symport family MFS transporter n=1 Tax=Vogesella oryzagri TaxID=3160864 RepID=A0ABV1M2K6_9NEIS
MSKTEAIDVRALINERPLGAFQKLVVFLGFLIIALDGFDVAIMSFIAPQLKQEWGVTNAMLGPVLSAALIGLALGALVAGPLADRFGRKGVLLCSVFFFGVWTLATALSTEVSHLIFFRFMTGLGLGAAMPNASTLVSEYAPDRRRSFLVTVVFCGFSLGAAGGGFLSGWMIPAFGWHSVLVLGGVLPLLVLPLLLFKLPESVRFLVARQAPAARIHRIVEQLAPGVSSERSRFVLPTAPASGNAIAVVLSPQYRFGTYMLWLSYFAGLFLVYLLGNWLPTLVKESGYSVQQAATITALYQIGGPLGCLSAGWLMDRLSPHRTLALIYLVGGCLTFAIGQSAGQFAVLGMLAFAVGFCMNGASTGTNALAAGFYPVEARATGASWMHSAGRLGAILSAFAGAQMLALGWSFQLIFALLMLPALVTALALLAKGSHVRRGLAPAIVRQV